MANGTLSPTSFSQAVGSPYTLTSYLTLEKGDLTTFDSISVSNISQSGFSITASGTVSTGRVDITVTGSGANLTVTFDLSVVYRYDDAGATNIETINQSFSLAITGATPTYTAPVCRTDTVTYDGTSQYLMSSYGSVTGGTMYYAATTSSVIPAASLAAVWTTTVSDTYKTNAGTYYVYYKIVGDTGYADVAPARATNTSVTIDEADQDWTYSLSSASVDQGDSVTLTISSATQYSSISATSDFNDVTISLAGLVFTITAGSTVGTTTITVTAVGATNYKDRTVTVSLVINDVNWGRASLYFYDSSSGSWKLGYAFIYTGSGWMNADLYIHK